MATIYDSTNPADIPAAPDGLVFAYNDGLYSQVAAVRARFPTARVITISAVGRASADVVDVEPGCVWPPANAVAYVRRERAAGNDPTVYCGRANWPAVIAAFDQAGVAQPRYWVAHYTNTPHLCSSSCYPSSVGSLAAVATQYGGDMPGHYDITVTDGTWPGGVAALGGDAQIITGNGQGDDDMPLTDQDVAKIWEYAIARGGLGPAPAWIWLADGRIAAGDDPWMHAMPGASDGMYAGAPAYIFLTDTRRILDSVIELLKAGNTVDVSTLDKITTLQVGTAASAKDIAAALLPALQSGIVGLSDADAAKLAKFVNDDAARRLAS